MSTDRQQTHVSFEFFPPRSAEAVTKLETTRDRLTRFGPEFYSVTFGAGGGGGLCTHARRISLGATRVTPPLPG